MNPIKQQISSLLPGFKEYNSSLNLGVILVGAYFIFDLGSVQFLFPIVRTVKLPLLITVATLGYAAVLLVTKSYLFSSWTSRYHIVFCFILMAYSVVSTRDSFDKQEMAKGFIYYWAIFIVVVGSITTCALSKCHHQTISRTYINTDFIENHVHHAMVHC